MASAPTRSKKKFTPTDSDNNNDSDSDIESDNYYDYESTDQTEDDLNSEDVEESDSEELPCDLETKVEKLSGIEATDIVRSCDLKKSGLAKNKKVQANLSALILKTLSSSHVVSLLKEFVESEFFLIDGDSLFITCFLNVSFKKGQTLHFFYLVEKFLHDFIQKEAKFMIVFFKDAESFYLSSPELQALRTALILHLENNTDVTIRTEFSNCLTPEWELFLTECFPYSLIVLERGITPLQTEFLHIFILHALQKEINIVLPLGLESDVMRIYGFSTTGSYWHKTNFAKHEKQLQHALHAGRLRYFQKSLKTEIFLYDHMKLNLKNLQKKIQKTLSKLQMLWPEGADIRSIVCAVSCSVTLRFYKKMYLCAQDYENVSTCSEDDSTQDWEDGPTFLEAADLCRMHCLSVIFLQKLPLSQRAKSRIITYNWNGMLSPFLRMLKKSEFFILEHLKFMNDWKVNFAGLPDLTDNILWKNIAYYYEGEYTRGLNLRMGDTLRLEYVKLWNIITKLSRVPSIGEPIPVRTTSRPFLVQKVASPIGSKIKKINSRIKSGSKKEIHQSGLIPLKSDIVQDFAGDILSQLPFLSSDDTAILALSTREFDECRHWHSLKLLSDDFGRTRCFSGNRSERIVRERTPHPSENSALLKMRKKQMTNANAKRNTEENKRIQLAEEEKKEKERWKKSSLSILKEIRENFNSGIKRLEDFLKACSIKSVKFIAEMAGLDACFKLWTEYCLKPEAKYKAINILINMMKRMQIIHEKYSEQLQSIHQLKLAQYLKDVGFGNVAHSLCYQVVESGTEKDTSQYSVHMGAARFQLTYMGPYLFREERSDPDPRVQHFIPDTWQRELLDVVDNNESAVIVAPTSSGKTYASYYCMEKILRESFDGVVVYVSPTKALVNQVVKTVCDLFTKTVPREEVLCGVFTRDYRRDVLCCRILVTVPQCLEILLLAPHNQEWVKKIRYVIFDEVHCLGGEIGAEVWEHLLVMIRCPFLALSATISNPEHLTEWLVLTKRYWQDIESTMEASGLSKYVAKHSRRKTKEQPHKASHGVRLVWHKERYNDVEKYVCSLKDNEFVIEHYHPCAALTVNHIKKCGIPSDLGLSPRESILLYDAMARTWPEWPRKQELEPEEFSYFKNKLVIKKADVKKYEEELKKEMVCWIELDPSKVKQLLTCLKPQTFDCEEKDKQKMFPYFVEKLKKMDRLPAIFFAFNIHRVEASALEIFRNLTGKEKNQNHPNSKKKKNLDKDVWKAKKSQKRKKAVSSGSNANSQKEKIWNDEIKEFDKYLEMNTQISSDCSYADDTTVDDETLTKILNGLMGARQGYKLHDLLQRGIGFHHGSMEREERQVVELLFRRNYVQVVIATSSLALGINMPCKSVVFTEDSSFLDALNFRQMSGRAGRRGEDLVGNVFFYGIPLRKVERLLKSNVPKLKGQFPLSVTFILRLMLLVAKADDKEDAKAKAMSALEHSLISFKRPKVKHIIKLYFIYSLQFLVREGYLNRECIPIGFSGLVSHLHYHEPANFVFVSMLVKGLFRKLCVPQKIHGSKTFPENLMETLVTVLAHLFGRKYLPPCVKECKKTSYDSEVILQELPKKYARMIEQYNNRIKTHFVSFLIMISKLADMRKEYQLPLSEIDFSDKECQDSELVSHLMPGTDNRCAVSPFACLSNVTNQDLVDINVLSDVILQTVDVNLKDVPLICLTKYDSIGREHPLNAYLLDFYRHGSLHALTIDNRLHMGDAFNLIKDFTLVLQSIRCSLRELCNNEDDNVVLAFEQLSDKFRQLLWS